MMEFEEEYNKIKKAVSTILGSSFSDHIDDCTNVIFLNIFKNGHLEQGKNISNQIVRLKAIDYLRENSLILDKRQQSKDSKRNIIYKKTVRNEYFDDGDDSRGKVQVLIEKKIVDNYNNERLGVNNIVSTKKYIGEYLSLLGVPLETKLWAKRLYGHNFKFKEPDGRLPRIARMWFSSSRKISRKFYKNRKFNS